MNDKIRLYLDKIKNKKILIQGLGLNGGGVGTALFFLKNGFDITITDLKNELELKESINTLLPYKDKITYVLGEHKESDFTGSDIIVKGPGVNPTNKYIQSAIRAGKIITSDIEIFFRITEAQVFGITGSKGKSTTVSAVYHIYRQKQTNSFLGGNITISPLTFYEKLNKESLVILELSSWQLRDLKDKNFLLKGSAITNLLADHQNYYTSMENYLYDKAVITENQSSSEFIILPLDDKYLNTDNIKTRAKIYYFSYDDEKADIFYKNDKAYFRKNNKLVELYNKNTILISGRHMHENILIAAGFSYLSGISTECIAEGVKTFKGAPFRMEIVKVWNGIKFINDTTATIPEASYNAILSFNEPIIWIAGGSDKNLDFAIFEKIYNKPKIIYLLKGSGTEKIKKVIKRNDMIESDSLEFILADAVKKARKGDVVLLSPGCASFGLFNNEFHRGAVFNDFVSNLK